MRRLNAGVEDVGLFRLLVFGRDNREDLLFVAVFALEETDCALVLLVFGIAHAAFVVLHPTNGLHAVSRVEVLNLLRGFAGGEGNEVDLALRRGAQY